MENTPNNWQYYQNRYTNDSQYAQQQYAQQNNGAGQYAAQPYAQPQYNQNFYAAPVTAESLPENLRPLSPWAYIGYGLLMAIPLVGFIVMLVFAFSSSGNINRRNYARSLLYMMIIALVLTAFFGILMAVLGVSVGNFVYEMM